MVKQGDQCKVVVALYAMDSLLSSNSETNYMYLRAEACKPVCVKRDMGFYMIDL
jgi:hypothetical protein